MTEIPSNRQFAAVTDSSLLALLGLPETAFMVPTFGAGAGLTRESPNLRISSGFQRALTF